jgi:hypothetical protein
LVEGAGGPHAIYKKCRERARHVPTRDEKDAAVHELCELPPVGSSPLPPELHGLDGDYLVLAHFDSIQERLARIAAEEEKAKRRLARVAAVLGKKL